MDIPEAPPSQPDPLSAAAPEHAAPPGDETAAEPAPDPAPLSPAGGVRYGRYRLVEKVGSGGMAEVFRAVAEGTHGFERTVAIKRIRADASANPELLRLFANEARLSAMLHHPNLVQVYEFGEVDGSYYLAMEYLPGKDLVQVLRALRACGERMPAGIAVLIARDVARGLAHAHELVDENRRPLLLVHRDVSPENVMLLHAGAVKLVDFGIARGEAQLRLSATQGRVLRGKCRYMAPEQINGAPVDARTDVFALGVMLWELLADRPLFAADSDFKTMENVMAEPVPPPSRFAPIPAALDGVVLCALSRDPARRYRSAAAMAADLDEVLRALPSRHRDIAALMHRLFARPTTRPSVETAPLDAFAERLPSGPPIGGLSSPLRALAQGPLDGDTTLPLRARPASFVGPVPEAPLPGGCEVDGETPTRVSPLSVISEEDRTHLRAPAGDVWTRAFGEHPPPAATTPPPAQRAARLRWRHAVIAVGAGLGMVAFALAVRSAAPPAGRVAAGPARARHEAALVEAQAAQAPGVAGPCAAAAGAICRPTPGSEPAAGPALAEAAAACRPDGPTPAVPVVAPAPPVAPAAEPAAAQVDPRPAEAPALATGEPEETTHRRSTSGKSARSSRRNGVRALAARDRAVRLLVAPPVAPERPARPDLPAVPILDLHVDPFAD